VQDHLSGLLNKDYARPTSGARTERLLRSSVGAGASAGTDRSVPTHGALPDAGGATWMNAVAPPPSPGHAPGGVKSVGAVRCMLSRAICY
jgi:hypothetical protein